jgi:Fungal Zn(2)-Cys(6) binuclear cluster domain
MSLRNPTTDTAISSSCRVLVERFYKYPHYPSITSRKVAIDCQRPSTQPKRAASGKTVPRSRRIAPSDTPSNSAIPMTARAASSKPQEVNAQLSLVYHRYHCNAGKEAGVKLSSRSKTGCWTCRTRKVKCDEGRPICGQCTRLEYTCDSVSLRRPTKLNSVLALGNTRTQ